MVKFRKYRFFYIYALPSHPLSRFLLLKASQAFITSYVGEAFSHTRTATEPHSLRSGGRDRRYKRYKCYIRSGKPHSLRSGGKPERVGRLFHSKLSLPSHPLARFLLLKASQAFITSFVGEAFSHIRTATEVAATSVTLPVVNRNGWAGFFIQNYHCPPTR